jgi:hypothetical protein
MTVFEIGKLYRWPGKDTCWSLYDNDGKWTKLSLSHQDVFLVLSFKKSDIALDLYTIKILISNGVIGITNIHKTYIRQFVKLQ